MTTREVFILGWVFGRLDPRGDTAHAAMRPFSAMGTTITNAHRKGILREDLDREIGEALCQIETIYPPMDGKTEKVQPLENQTAWYMGYYAGCAGKPLPPTFDITAARKAKGMTQEQLAEKMGVDQGHISRWESGKVTPNKESLKKLKELLR